MWVSIIVTGVLVVWAFSIAVVIIMQRRSAAATLAWILTLMFLPILGLVVYRLIGPLRLERKKLKRRGNRKVIGEALTALQALPGDGAEHVQLARLSMRLGEASPLRADDIQVYLDGASNYEAILAAIGEAKHHVHLEYYIWEPDAIGTRLRDALIERKRAGVQVRMIVDGTGSNKLSKKFLQPLRDAGVDVAWFNPIRLRSLRPRRPDFRTHRKIVVCDGTVGFTGGMNVADAHSAKLSSEYWRDTHMRITGSAVWALQRLFVEDWSFAHEAPCPIDAYTFPTPTLAGPHLVQILGSGPDSDSYAIHKAVFTAINQADRRVWLTTPYFVPDEPLLSALVSAGLRGVDTRLIVPKRGDSKLVDLAARSYFPELLAAGVRVYEYEPRFIHAKTVVCDEEVAIIGTANLDNRSFRLNFECAAIVYGEPVNRHLADAFTTDLHDCREFNRKSLAAESFKTRFGQAAARLISPLL